MAARNNRRKISTTVSKENDELFKSMIRSGEAASLAEVLDRLGNRERRARARRRLETETAAYYASLSGKSLAAEKRMELAIARAASLVDFDGE